MANYISSHTGAQIDNAIDLSIGDLTPAEITTLLSTKASYSTATTGSVTRPIYLNNGMITQCDPFILIFENQTVATSAWTSDATYSDYPYVATISLSNVTASHYPEVVFNLTDATSGYFAPICESIAGGVKIWATDIPSAAITIPTIKCTKAN